MLNQTVETAEGSGVRISAQAEKNGADAIEIQRVAKLTTDAEASDAPSLTSEVADARRAAVALVTMIRETDRNKCLEELRAQMNEHHAACARDIQAAREEAAATHAKVKAKLADSVVPLLASFAALIESEPIKSVRGLLDAYPAQKDDVFLRLAERLDHKILAVAFAVAAGRADDVGDAAFFEFGTSTGVSAASSVLEAALNSGFAIAVRQAAENLAIVVHHAKATAQPEKAQKVRRCLTAADFNVALVGT